jgi:phage tail sheath protein FI
VASAFVSDIPVPLKKGSEGDLRTASGDVDTAEAETLLEQAYAGLLTNPYTGELEDQIYDTETIYFSLVFDAGYPADVKTAISGLCTTRRDCVGILDNGDNNSVNAALAARNNVNTFNNFYVALYESYNKVSDPFTGEDVWFSPIYHMSYIIPRNDNVAELWFAPAGFNRAAIDSIKEIRYNPRLGQRDQLYLKQLNPIVKFSNGYVVWGQLTAQAKASALQDLNIVRLVLYCKRAIEQFCRFFIFEQNDPITWGQVSGAITDFLEVIKQKRGLDSYSIDVGATDYERKTKRFHVDIILQPTRTVEQIELNFFIQ